MSSSSGESNHVGQPQQPIIVIPPSTSSSSLSMTNSPVIGKSSHHLSLTLFSLASAMHWGRSLVSSWLEEVGVVDSTRVPLPAVPVRPALSRLWEEARYTFWLAGRTAAVERISTPHMCFCSGENHLYIHVNVNPFLTTYEKGVNICQGWYVHIVVLDHTKWSLFCAQIH